MRITKRVWLAAGVVTLLAACGGDDGPSVPPPGEGEDAVAVLDEWSIAVEPDGAEAGPVIIRVNNAGERAHELTVIDTDLPADDLPMAQHLVDEDTVEPVGTTRVMIGGASETLEINLPAGRYVLICNLPTHYEQGMYTGFTVE